MAKVKFAQGKFFPKNPDKYVGKKTPKYRSSWEYIFMQLCDNNPAVTKWASESVTIPYIDPFTGKRTVYIPDFLIVYQDQNNKRHAELIEIKPLKESTMERAGKSARNRLMVVKNDAKWKAARAWCRAQGLVFRVVTENDIFHQGSSIKRK